MIRLFSLAEPFESAATPKWVRNCAEIMRGRISEPAFPCYFASKSLAQGTMLISYVDRDEVDNPLKLAEALRSFLARKGGQGLPVLLVFINLDAIDFFECEQHFWRFLQSLQRLSRFAEPFSPTDPNWTLQFDGSRLFVNAHSRFYRKRRSRWAPSDLMLVIQPMANLDKLAVSEPAVQQISDTIRRKALQYDGRGLPAAFGRHFCDPDTSYAEQYWVNDN